MRLGDYLAPEQKQEAFNATLVPGNVLYLDDCSFTNPRKPKYVVLVGRDEEACLIFVINSDPSRYVQGKPWLAQCQVTLAQSDYAFLRRDSQLNCAEVIDSMSATSVAGELSRGTAKYVGALTNKTKEQIVAVVDTATTIMPFHKDIIRSSLT